MTASTRVVVVGAGLAGLRACESLRRQGFAGRVTLVGAERHPPYSRPPLSKGLLRGEVGAAKVALRPPEDYTALDLELLLGTAAMRLDPAAHEVHLADGRALPYDRLVLTCGSEPRRLPGSEGLRGVHVLRTLDDALAIRDGLARARRVVVVGGGFIGAEVAASARALGREVTLVEALPVPLGAALGEELAGVLARRHAEQGVQVRGGAAVAAVEGHDAVEAVRLADGEQLAADLVVVGVGVRPATAWLEGSGLPLGDGVVCDAWCRAGAPDVYAAGDVARWHNPLYGEPMRVEHWATAGEQAAYVGRSMFAHDPPPFEAVPYFWSDQYDLKLGYLGRPGPGDEVRVVHGSPGGGRLLALSRLGDRLAGVVSIGMTRVLMRLRPALAARASWQDGLDVAAALLPG